METDKKDTVKKEAKKEVKKEVKKVEEKKEEDSTKDEDGYALDNNIIFLLKSYKNNNVDSNFSSNTRWK